MEGGWGGGFAHLGRGEQRAEEAGAQAGGADLLLLRLRVVGVLQQLDLVQNQAWETLRSTAETPVTPGTMRLDSVYTWTFMCFSNMLAICF